MRNGVCLMVASLDSHFVGQRIVGCLMTAVAWLSRGSRVVALGFLARQWRGELIGNDALNYQRPGLSCRTSRVTGVWRRRHAHVK